MLMMRQHDDQAMLRDIHFKEEEAPPIVLG
jgi:hypothetical protein